jgi:hypothetical protein
LQLAAAFVTMRARMDAPAFRFLSFDQTKAELAIGLLQKS